MKKIFLHIGLHKTGSSSLQAFLYKNADKLRDYGYLYPKMGIPFKGEAHHNLAWLLKNETHRADFNFGTWSEFHKEIETTNLDNIIISSEDFEPGKRIIDSLKLELKFYEVKIIAYIRRQDLRLESQYIQHIKQGLDCENIFSFCKKQRRNSDYYKLLKLWEQAFGLNNLIVRPLEKAQISNICQDFLKILGVNNFKYFDKTKNKNTRPGSKTLEALKFVSKVYKKELHQEKKKYLNIIAYYTQKHWYEENNYRLLSYSESSKILKWYEQSNQAVAREYLGRENGILFYEKLESYNNHKLDIGDLSRDELLELLRLVITIESTKQIKTNESRGQYKASKLQEKTKNEQIEATITPSQKAIELKPDNSIIYAKLARVMMAQQNFQEAIANYQQAIALQQKQPAWVYVGLGDAFNQNGQVKEAIASYQQAIEIKPNLNHFIYQKLGEACQQQKRLDEAVEYFMETLKRNPSFKPAYKCLGNALQQLGKENQKNLDKLFAENCIIPQTIINKFCSLKDYDLITSFTLVKDLDYIKVESKSNTIELIKAKTIPNGVHHSFPKFRKQGEAFITKVVNGQAWVDPINVAVITASKQLIKNASSGNPELGIYAKDLHSPLEIDGSLAILSRRSNLPGYYHWMTQVIPQISLLERSGVKLDAIDKFALIKNFQSPFRKETLDILGIPQSKVIELYNNPYIKANSLIVPSYLPISQKWAFDCLRNKFLNNKVESIDRVKRIYVSRQNASSRRIINYDHLEAFLENFGFETINLESLSVLEQAALFSKAEIIIAPHGAGLTNLIFCSPGTKVIEIFAKDYIPPDYQVISSYYFLEYYYLICEGVKNVNHVHPRQQNFVVDLNSLLELMKLAEII